MIKSDFGDKNVWYRDPPKESVDHFIKALQSVPQSI
jgi:hypothetical protein